MTQDLELKDLTLQLKAKNRARRKAMKGLNVPSARLRNDVVPALSLADVALADIAMKGRRIRKLDPIHIQQTMGSIQTLGFCAPILIGTENTLIDGAVRIEAARLLGLAKVPCIRMGHLSEAEQRTLRLAANRLAEKGQWDLDELKLEFEELMDLDAPIEISGFSIDEIDHVTLGDDVGIPEVGPLAPEADVEPNARLGDIYRLGPHRLICGDATDPNVIRSLMGDLPRGSASLVLTDEPYNVPIAGHVTQGNHREFAMASGEMSDGEFQTFNYKWMAAILPYLADGGMLATFIDWRGLPLVHAAASELELDQLNLVIWSKTNGGMGSLYRSQHELLPIYKKGTAAHVNNVGLSKRGRYRTNVWTYPGASSLGSDARKGLQEHPTVKPSAMLEDALLDITNRGDLVVDPFLGSGSTLIAAHKTRRICFGIELDPRYVDVIVRRFEAATGLRAVLEERCDSRPASMNSFDQL